MYYTQPVVTGYPQVNTNNIWNTGSSYSNQNNNVTNIFAGSGGSSTSIFGNSSGTVSHVPMDSIMLAPFGAQKSSSYEVSVQSQNQTPDYTGKMFDMMSQMMMMAFMKKMNEDSSSSTPQTEEIVVEDTSDAEKKAKQEKAAKVIGHNVKGSLIGGALLGPGGAVFGGIMGAFKGLKI